MADATSTSIDTADIQAIDASAVRSTASAPFGITRDGFFPKPFARILAEKLTLSRALFGEDVDLTSGSAIRKLLEVSALEDARTWAALASMYDNSFVSTATGDALSLLGEELALPRPFLEARGRVKLKLVGALPAGATEVVIARGARLLTSGGHHVATAERATLSPASTEREIGVEAFYPGPEHNLDPAAAVGATFPQKIALLNQLDPALKDIVDAEKAAGAPIVAIEHTQKLSGGELRWPDARYRTLLLSAPRSLWTVDAIETAASLVPGVRQVQVRDAWGGLDIRKSIFGNFNFIERLFSEERDLGSPYYFTVLVAPTPAAIWEGPEGLEAAVASAIEDLRPIGIFPQIQEATQVFVGVSAQLVVRGIPLPSGTPQTVNGSGAAIALKARLLQRVQAYLDRLGFGEPVRVAEVMWVLMNEPGIADVRNLQLVRYPPKWDTLDFVNAAPNAAVQLLGCGENIDLQVNEIAVFVDDPSRLTII